LGSPQIAQIHGGFVGDPKSQSVHPLVPSRLFISNGAGAKSGNAQGNGSVLETLLSSS
jgi:hypothetical protein